MPKMLILTRYSAVLTVALTAITTPSVEAQTLPDRFACQAGVVLNRGVSLTYRLAGTLPETTAADVRQNPSGASLTLAVQWRDRTGRVQSLLNGAAMTDYERVAPGGNAAQLPFEAMFRSSSDNTDRLFGTPASVHGLYVSLRPTSGKPQQMQTVHYLRSGESVRSTVGVCYPENADLDLVDPKLTHLRERLQAEDWAGADLETRRLLAPESVSLSPSDPALVSPDLIQAIDQMWLTASDGRFGLSVQLRLWQEALADRPNDNEAAVNAFRDRVGWKLAAPRAEVDFISSDWRNESELTYSLQAPEGHLPWVGVSDAVVRGIAVPPEGFHCGSCTIDAMQLRNERFYGYIPRLMERIKSSGGVR